jgi:hypothetical protein
MVSILPRSVLTLKSWVTSTSDRPASPYDSYLDLGDDGTPSRSRSFGYRSSISTISTRRTSSASGASGASYFQFLRGHINASHTDSLDESLDPMTPRPPSRLVPDAIVACPRDLEAHSPYPRSLSSPPSSEQCHRESILGFLISSAVRPDSGPLLPTSAVTSERGSTGPRYGHILEHTVSVDTDRPRLSLRLSRLSFGSFRIRSPLLDSVDSANPHSSWDIEQGQSWPILRRSSSNAEIPRPSETTQQEQDTPAGEQFLSIFHQPAPRQALKGDRQRHHLSSTSHASRQKSVTSASSFFEFDRDSQTDDASTPKARLFREVYSGLHGVDERTEEAPSGPGRPGRDCEEDAPPSVNFREATKDDSASGFQSQDSHGAALPPISQVNPM